MNEFIKNSLKVQNLYIDIEFVNQIIEELKVEIIGNKESFLKIYNKDIEKCEMNININNIIELLNLYKNSEISKQNKKTIDLVSYYGNPYITINLCMQSLISKKSIIAVIEDNMVGINTFIVKIFNVILERHKIIPLIKIYNMVKTEEIKQIQNYLSNVICVGNSQNYYNYKNNNIENLKYIPFKNMIIYCENEEYEKLQFELFKFGVSNKIEIEVCEDIEEFIETIDVDKTIENIVCLTNNKNTVKYIQEKIENKKIFINQNPFKDERFKIHIV